SSSSWLEQLAGSAQRTWGLPAQARTFCSGGKMPVESASMPLVLSMTALTSSLNDCGTLLDPYTRLFKSVLIAPSAALPLAALMIEGVRPCRSTIRLSRPCAPPPPERLARNDLVYGSASS